MKALINEELRTIAGALKLLEGGVSYRHDIVIVHPILWPDEILNPTKKTTTTGNSIHHQNRVKLSSEIH